MKNIISSVKNKILPKYLSKDIEKNVSKNVQNYKDKSTDINILLNRVRLDEKKVLKKKIIFSIIVISLVSSLAIFFTL